VVDQGSGLAAIGGPSRARRDLVVVCRAQPVLVRYLRGVCGLLALQKLQGFRGGLAKPISKRVDIEAAEKDTYLPGDVVNVCVRVMRKEELDIEEARVALVCTNRYVYQYTRPDSSDNQVYRTKEVTEEVEAGDERILEEKTILSGS
jgi:hypothetical protein